MIKITTKTCPLCGNATVLFDDIDKILYCEIAACGWQHSVILLNEAHLGTCATEKQALKMITLLRRKGYYVEYGEPVQSYQKPSKIPDSIWLELMEKI